MRITEDLLKRYAEGDCSLYEKLIVEEWLASADTEESFPDQFDKKMTQRHVWQRIRVNLRLPVQRQLSWVHAQWAAAACAVMISGIATYKSYCQYAGKPSSVFLSNHLQSHQMYQTGGFRLNLGRRSAAKLNVTECGDLRAIDFNGVVELGNVTDKDIEVAFQCTGKNGQQETLKVNCEVGRTYLLVPNESDQKHFTIIDKKHVTLLPIPLLEKVQTELLFI